LMNAMAAALNAIINAVNAQLGIASPSKVFMDIGKQMMAGLELGIMNSLAPSAIAPVGGGSMTNNSVSINVPTTINREMDIVQWQGIVVQTVRDALR